MLSRIAEALFWIGRYVERAEDTARLLDVQLHLLVEDPWLDEAVACKNLLSVMGASSAGPWDRRQVLQQLAWDPASAASIVASIGGPGRTPAAPGRRSPPRCGRC